MTQIRIYCIVDDILRLQEARIKSAMDKAWEAYKLGSGYRLEAKYDIEYRNLASVPWEYYTVVEDDGRTVKDKYMGFGFSWITQDTKRVWSKNEWAYDCVLYVVASQNWHTEGAWGWNLGGFFNNYQVQLVKDIQNEHLWKGFAMEVFHAMDNFVYAETGKSLEQVLGVENFDRDVVHGIKDPPFKVFDYGMAIAMCQDQLIEAFESRAKKHLVSLLKLYIALLRQYIAYLMNRRSVPLVENPKSHGYP